MKSYIAVLVVLALMSLGPASSANVGCMQCNSLNAQCVSKNAVMTCPTGIGNPQLIRCPSGTFCDVNKLPWCGADYKPLCPR